MINTIIGITNKKKNIKDIHEFNTFQPFKWSKRKGKRGRERERGNKGETRGERERGRGKQVIKWARCYAGVIWEASCFHGGVGQVLIKAR